ncbi:MAG: DnaJ domain-containing protein, partial [Alphaproteobacteria bacterium]|nr:DnaJ domain-containing protein [Alphaproteobacteria bacterium]
MAKKDYYEILGSDKKASAGDLKKAYRRMAMKYHPDKNPGNNEAEHKFKEASEAYDILKDDQKRAAYDRFGHSAFQGGNSGARQGTHHGGFSGGGFTDIFEEMFGDFMGGQAQAGRRSDGGGVRRGADIS